MRFEYFLTLFLCIYAWIYGSQRIAFEGCFCVIYFNGLCYAASFVKEERKVFFFTKLRSVVT